VSRHVLHEVPVLEKWKVLARGTPSEYSLEIPIFKVEKAGGADARLIGDCRILNELLPRPGPMGLPGIHDVLRHLLRQNYLHQLDARSYFYQFTLHPSLSDIMTSRCGGARGNFSYTKWLVMAMGLSFAPGIAQHTSLHICANVVNGSEETLLPWVDNFLFGSQTECAMTDLLQRFESVRKTVNLDIKPSTDSPTRVMSCLGLQLDCSGDDVDDHFATLDTKFLENLKISREQLCLDMTPREFYQVFGSLMWANFAIMRQPLARWIHGLEYVRMKSRDLVSDQKLWDIRCAVPQEVREDLYEMIDEALVAKITLRDLTIPHPDEILWSDASSFALAYVKEGYSGSYALSRTYAGLAIYAAELLAASECLNSTTSDHPLQVVDNRGAGFSLVKGHSSTRAGNIILNRLWENWNSDKKAWVAWTPSGCNKSDPTSRGCGALPMLPPGPCQHVEEPRPILWRGRKKGGD